jgi:LTXXQ motif family protein
MRPSTLPIVCAVALSLAVPSIADARPRFGPAALLGVVAAPLGAVLGGYRPSFTRHRRSAARPSDDQRGNDDARVERRAAASASAAPTAAGFWPDASADLVEYLLFPKGKEDRFWAYGYGTIVGAAFAASNADDPRALRGRRVANQESNAASPARVADPSATADLCASGPAAGDANALIERIEQAIGPSASQREVLEQLRTALAQAIERIKAACPAMPATLTNRLKTIQDRIWAMRDALLTIRLPFERFHDSLTNEQHWRLYRGVPDAREVGAKNADGRGQMCVEPAAGLADWPMRAIERAVRPSEQQRASLEALRQRSAAMAQLIVSSCPTYPLLGHMGRFAAATDRLDVMLFAVMTMSPALQDFHDSLSDQQKTGLDRVLRQIRRSGPAGDGS